MTGVALLVITDGRDDYLARTLESAGRMLKGPIVERWMFDDTGDEDYRRELRAAYPEFQHLPGVPLRRQGFGGAIARSWNALGARSRASHVFHLEQDFVFNYEVPLADMLTVLDHHPELAQMALRRQPWNDAERAAGGVIEQHPADYLDAWCHSCPGAWLEHRRFFTTNPSLYRIGLTYRGWSHNSQSEGRFGIELFAERPSERCAFWGYRKDTPWVEHIGSERVGTGY